MKLKPEVKKLWCETLRSGEYKQTKEQLRDDDGYCCLGVLCDISGCADWYDYEYDGDETYPPPSVDEWAREDPRRAECKREDRTSDWEPITKLNDVEELTFPEIADWIEVNL